jgi:hypothetical protein
MKKRRSSKSPSKPPPLPQSRPTEPFAPRNPTTGLATAVVITGLFVAIISYIAWHHEMWRDEVRALNIAAAARSLPNLFALLHNEGHPPLWYLLLYAGYGLTHSMLVLKPISLACAVGAAYLLLRYAPFPIWIKALFLCGAFPLYQYSVICRNYGISMLLIFAVAALYPRRFSRPLPLGIALVLLANTNAYALMIAGAFLAALVAEALVSRPTWERGAFVSGIAGALLVVTGMIAAVAVMLPDATSVVSKSSKFGASAVMAALGAGAVAAPAALRTVMTGGNAILAGALFVALTLYLVTRPWLLVIWISAAWGFSSFASLVYAADPLQLGLLFVLALTLLWIDRSDPNPPRMPGWLAPGWPRVLQAKDALTILVLLPQAYWGFRTAWMDLHAEISSSERLGRYIKSTATLRDAIVLAEPDYMVEPLPYYVPNRIYLPREGKDMIKIDLTTERKARLTLDEFLDAGITLKRDTGRPVLMVIQPLDPRGPFVLKYPYGFEFEYSPQSLERFQSIVEPLVVFDKAVSDENYWLCQLH